jgi:uncharacterized protein YuzE
MKITYDHSVDALYIQLADHPVVQTKQINDSCILDFDEFDHVIGIEILDARAADIDPLRILTDHYTPDHPRQTPPPDVVARIAAEREAARNRWKARRIAHETVK